MVKFKDEVVLCVFAHPDDEVLGAGGMLHSMSCSKNLAILSAYRDERGDPEADQSGDCYAAAMELGIDGEIIFGIFKDNQFDSYPRLDIIKWVESSIDKVKPTTILTHHKGDINIDHRYCYEAVMTATRRNKINVISCEIPGVTGWLKPSAWEPNMYVSLTPDDMQAKIKAMGCYKSEMQDFPGERSPDSLHYLARVRGFESNCGLAESFMIERSFY